MAISHGKIHWNWGYLIFRLVTNPRAELYLRDGEMSEAAANEAVKVLNDSRRIEDSWVVSECLH